MVSKKLRFLYLLSIPFFLAHGIEELINNFWTFDSFYVNFGDYAKVVYVLGQMILIALAVIIYRFILKGKYGLIVSILWGLLLFYELEHTHQAIRLGLYTPGLFTGLLLAFFGLIYWREIFRNWSKRYQKN